MKKFLFFLLLAGSVLAFGQEQKLVTVEARGMGTSPDAATKDALSQAIQQAAGAIVDSQTLMKNDEIMQEKILTASNAIVKKYDVVVPVKKNRNGLFEIRIRAEVEQNLLRQKLIEHKIIEGKVEGTQNIWAEVVTQEKNQVDMQAMIENTISKIDVRKYLQFNIIGINRKMGSEAKLYMKPLPNNNRKIYVEAGLVCFFDSARFYEECVKPIEKIFNKLSFESKHQFIRQGTISTIEYRFMLSYFNEKSIPMATLRVFDYDHWSRVLKCAAHSDNKCVILLNVSPKYRVGNQRFICFSHEPRNGHRPFYRGNEETKKLFDGFSAALCLLDREGNEIRRMEHKFDDMSEFLGAGIFKEGATITITPEFIMGSWLGRGYCSNTVVVPLSVVIDVEDFKEIKSFKLEVNRGK